MLTLLKLFIYSINIPMKRRTGEKKSIIIQLPIVIQKAWNTTINTRQNARLWFNTLCVDLTKFTTYTSFIWGTYMTLQAQRRVHTLISVLLHFSIFPGLNLPKRALILSNTKPSPADRNDAEWGTDSDLFLGRPLKMLLSRRGTSAKHC